MSRRLLFLLLPLIGLTGPTRGGLVIVTPAVVLTSPGSTGWFDVNVQYIPDVVNPTYSVAGFMVSLAVSGSDVVFTGVDDATAAPYLLNFPGSNATGLTILDPDPFPPGGTASLTFYDSASPPTFPGRTMNANDVFGLGRVYYSVSPSATYGNRALTLDPPVPTGLSDLTASNGSSIIGGVSGGYISVVPEPSVLALSLCCSLAATLPLAWRRLRKAA